MNYLENAFKKLSIIDEDVFELDKEGITDLKDFIGDGEEEVDDTVEVIDTEADNEEELEDSYIGKVILDCSVCHSKIFEDADEVELSEDGEIANVGEECPYCYSTDGFTVIGEVKEYCDNCEHDDEHHDEEDEHEEDEEDEVEVEVKEKEKAEESLKRSKKAIKESATVCGKKKIRESSKRDDIDAEADNRKERLKKYIQRKRDDIDSDRDYRLKRGITRRDESCKKKPCKEALSYGELAAIEDEWQKFKKKKGSNDADTAWEFIETECKGVYDTDEEKDAVFAYIGSLEESKKSRKRCVEGYRGAENVEFVSHGSWADPDLVYNGYTFNYWDIEDALWGDFLEVTGHKDSEANDPEVEEEFNEYVRDNVEGYLDDVIYGGYFEKGSKSWHDRYKKESKKFVHEGRKITEAPVYGLTPKFDSRKSFYGKATVDTGDKGDKNRLYSYDTLVAEIIDGKPVIHTDNSYFVNGRYSPTTMRHIKDWLKQLGFKAETSAQMIADYASKNECVKESIESISVDTGDQIIDVTAKDKEEEFEDAKETGEEVLAPLSDEMKDEIVTNTEDDENEENVDMEIDDFSEESFDDLGEKYFKEAYKNIMGYKTTNVFQRGNKLKVEGVIKFSTGKSKKTSFMFEASQATRDGKASFLGENKEISNGTKAFTLIGSLNNGKFLSESLAYNYKTNSRNIKGTVTR